MEEPTGTAGKTTTVKVGSMDIVLAVKGDLAFVPASLKLSNGEPRFHLSFPRELGNTDQGAKYFVFHETKEGYDPPTRNLLERILQPGDLFIDVGAHWGFFTLQAATHPAGNVAVIAFEPDPTNASILLRNIANNGLHETVSVVCAACGDNFDLAPLVTNSSMMHSIHGIGLKRPGFARGPAHWVSVISLDSTLARFPQASDRRVILKIDAEGFEPRVIAGARALLQGGRVAMIIWECGQAFSDGPDRDAMLTMVSTLNNLGFHHLRPVSNEGDSPLTPFFTAEKYETNVYSCSPGVLQACDKLLAIRPDDMSALNDRGLALHELKRFDEALECYDKILTLRPNIVEALYNRGNALLQLRRFDEALANYDKALVTNPDFVIALNNRGRVLEQLNRLDEALASYDKALTIKPQFAIALNNRDSLLQKLKVASEPKQDGA
jgi:FkbM family methyltransferase